MNDEAQRVFDAELDRILLLIQELTAKVDYLMKREKKVEQMEYRVDQQPRYKADYYRERKNKKSEQEKQTKENLEFDVEEVSFSVENNHGFLKLKLPYGYSKIEGILSKGDKVTVSFTIPF